jgi:WD40 repeat protein
VSDAERRAREEQQRRKRSFAIYDAQTDRQIRVPEANEGSLSDLFFNPDGRILYTLAGNELLAWNTEQWHTEWSISSKMPIQVVQSHDGGKLLSTRWMMYEFDYGEFPIEVWAADSGTHLATCAGAPNSIKAACFTPDGTRIVSVSSEARVWDAQTGALLATLPLHFEPSDLLPAIDAGNDVFELNYHGGGRAAWSRRRPEW